MVPDLADRVVEPPQGLGDPLPGRVVRQFDGVLQAEADVIEAADNPVEQFPSLVALPRRGGGMGEVGEVGARSAVRYVPDHGHDECPVAVGTGLRLTRTGNVLASLRSPTSRALAAICLTVGCCW